MTLQETNIVVSKIPKAEVTKEQPNKVTTKKTIIRTESQPEYPVTTEVSCQNQYTQH